VGPWRGDARVAYLAPVAETPPPTADMVRWCCTLLARRGYAEAVTGALAAPERAGFVAAGFEVREELHLLSHDLVDLPPAPAMPLRRGWRPDRRPALEVDARAFSTFWRLDAAGLGEALAATPVVRFRVVGRNPVTGYAVSGLAGRQGYLQRLAVDPAEWGQGQGRALVLDGLHWMRRRGARRAVVNTQVGNERALALYEALGFELQPIGLAVLARRLPDRELTS
jgi:ribosomal protein S18 acetylase RimI-like enzyme